MNPIEQLHREIDQLPVPLAQEALDLLRDLRARHPAPTTAPDALAERIANPWKVDSFKPLSREAAHER